VSLEQEGGDDYSPRHMAGPKLLGISVRKRREALHLTQEDVAERHSGPSVASMRTIENAQARTYRSKTLFSLDAALAWPRGTAIFLLSGDPDRFTGENGLNHQDLVIERVLSEWIARDRVTAKTFDEFVDYIVTAVSNEEMETFDIPVSSVAVGAPALLARTYHTTVDSRSTYPPISEPLVPSPGSLGRKVFVVHGRDRRARREFFTFLRSIGLEPMEWNEALAATNSGAPFIGDVLDSVLKLPHAFIVLLTPDDVVRLGRDHAVNEDDPDLQLSGQARPNVLFEAGMALALAPSRTILVELGKVRQFTDVGGRFVVRLNNSPQSRNTLAQRLLRIGCDVNLCGTDWQTVGDLTPPLPDFEDRPVLEPDAELSKKPTITTSVGDNNLTLENFNVTENRHRGLSLHGEVVNASRTTYTILLKGTFYDPSRKILGTATAFVNSISPGEMRTFEMICRDNVDGYNAIHVQIDTAIEG
jgi:predicted nucleotide-binding protein with TIR-like domain